MLVRRSAGFHRHAVEHLQPNELAQLHRGDHAFVHVDGQRPLPAERLVAADLIGPQRSFQHIHSRIGQLRRDLQGRRQVIASVGIGPQKSVRCRLTNLPRELDVELRVRRYLDVEVPVAALAAGLQQRRDLVQRAQD